MERDWIVYDEPPRVQRGRISMYLNQRFDLVINGPAYDALGKPKAVFLLYSPTTDAIAIEKADPRIENAHAVGCKNSNGSYRIYLKPLCDRHEIKYDCTVRFMDITVEDDKLVANLLKTRPVPRRKRS